MSYVEALGISTESLGSSIGNLAAGGGALGTGDRVLATAVRASVNDKGVREQCQGVGDLHRAPIMGLSLDPLLAECPSMESQHGDLSS